MTPHVAEARYHPELRQPTSSIPQSSDKHGLDPVHSVFRLIEYDQGGTFGYCHRCLIHAQDSCHERLEVCIRLADTRQNFARMRIHCRHQLAGKPVRGSLRHRMCATALSAPCCINSLRNTFPRSRRTVQRRAPPCQNMSSRSSRNSSSAVGLGGPPGTWVPACVL